MIKIIDINKNELQELKKYVISKETMESTVYLFKDNEDKKVFKLFKDNIDIENKVKKMKLLNERLKGINNVVTAESFIRYNDKIIGYTMPFVNGNLYSGLNYNKKQNIIILKEIAQIMKKLHILNIVCGDIHLNTMIDKNNNPILIDYDNFAIDNLKIDTKNIYLKHYEEIIENIDYHFDNYLMNLFTLSIITKIYTKFLEQQYYINPHRFNFKDKEIRDIIENTFNLEKIYTEELIVDKIETDKDLKKIKRKIF